MCYSKLDVLLSNFPSHVRGVKSGANVVFFFFPANSGFVILVF